jgi:hypothetical protein
MVLALLLFVFLTGAAINHREITPPGFSFPPEKYNRRHIALEILKPS